MDPISQAERLIIECFNSGKIPRALKMRLSTYQQLTAALQRPSLSIFLGDETQIVIVPTLPLGEMVVEAMPAADGEE